MNKSILILLSVVWSFGLPAAAAQNPAPLQWFKGNTHAHTIESDGDSPPEVVAQWYRDHGYNFLVITDHNVLVAVDGLNAKLAKPGTFIVIKGEEVTNRLGDKAVHVNGLDTRTQIGAQTGTTVVELAQKSVDAIRREGGVPHINHPNFKWSVTPEELGQVRNNKLFEIYSGHPMTNNEGGGDAPGLEAAWDAILSGGMLLYGIAVDDAHTFKDPGNRDLAGPGRGWVVVRAASLDARAILDAMERGDFYASTGVELTDYEVTPKGMTVTVKPNTFARYRVQFIGKGGVLLSEVNATSSATYEFRGDEGYVRAKVLDSNGRVAWLQPSLVAPR